MNGLIFIKLKFASSSIKTYSVLKTGVSEGDEINTMETFTCTYNVLNIKISIALTPTRSICL